jgi:hypothetical protein
VNKPWPAVARRLFAAIALLTLSAVVSATTALPEPDATGNYSMSDIVDVLSSQSRELAEQRRLIQAQTDQIAALKDQLDALKGGASLATSPDTPTPTPTQTPTQTPAPTVAPTPPAVAAARPTTTAQEAKAEQKTKTTEQVDRAQRDDPTKDELADFVGAVRLPGTRAALRIDGFVKSTVVDSLDPLETNDRFIVGSIPVGPNTEGIEEEAAITANQSRLAFDLREPTGNGILRAFIEGDFDGGDNGNQFRLRHAFGQWDRVLAGQTWTTFMDTDASPEEIDFEGLNGRLNVRQPQIRLFPQIGERYHLAVAAEDPNPQVFNGNGVTRFPDIVATGRVDWGPYLHFKVGGLYRQIRADFADSPGKTEKKTGWGLTVSGRVDVDWFDDRDSILFQVNGGSGIGRYVNDLSSVGSFDGVFDENGELELIDVVSGYVSGQHWWGRTMRSNLTFGYVKLDNPGFVGDDFYKQTLRLSGNLLWSPTPRVTLGGELLWGERENEDGESGDARQVQFSARYSF